jgi:hypothetical protein
LQVLRLAKVGDGDTARLVGIAGECGMDFDYLAVADHQQRRVFQFEGVVGELLQRRAQVAPRPLVFPAEVATMRSNAQTNYYRQLADLTEKFVTQEAARV